jgi:hypothetical protein
MLIPILALALQVHPPQTGTDLYEDCQSAVRYADSGGENLSNDEVAKGLTCMAFIDGYHDGLWEGNETICIPSDVSVETLVRGYLRFMQKNPTLMNPPKNIGLNFALRDAYSCPVKR